MFKRDKSAVEWLNKIFTDVYKILGFVILTAILLGLGSYFALNLYYLTSTKWVAPVILSANHEKVIRLNGELTDYMDRHDKLVSERSELKAQKEYIELAITAQEEFRQQLLGAMKSELAGRRAELSQFQRLMGDFRQTGKLSADALKDYKNLSVEQLTNEYEANLIDRQAFVDGTYTLSQVENSRLTRQARQIQVAARWAQLSREVAALEAALQDPTSGPTAGESVAPLTFEVVAMWREYRSAALDAGKLRAEDATLQERIAMLDSSIARYERLQRELKSSPYLRATRQQVAIAFVPYENMADAAVGTPVYGCSLGMLWCREVGKVARVLGGEVTTGHPLYNEQVRGQMVELSLIEPSWAEKSALFTGRAPFFI